MVLTAKLTIDAPKTPGAMPSRIGEAATVAEARAIAEDFCDRSGKWLRHQDVEIRTADGVRIEFAGPAK